jgi:hypothetical protein
MDHQVRLWRRKAAKAAGLDYLSHEIGSRLCDLFAQQLLA